MILAIALVLGLSLPADLIGTWSYDGYIYQDQRQPRPNPNLDLRFTFKNDGRVNLYWSRSNEIGFCEREAKYSLADNLLSQDIDWVNPQNMSECQNDLDMQLGRKSVTQIGIVEDELHFYLDLNGSEFIYVLKKIPSDPNI